MKKRAEKRAARMFSLAVAIIVMFTSVNMEALAVNRVARSFLTVMFESNGGSAVESQSVMIGNYIEKPEDPTREGYLFDGWFEDEELTDEWDFESDSVDYDKVNPQVDGIILYAKWVAEEIEDIAIDEAAPTLTSTSSANNRAGTFAGVTVTHPSLTVDNFSSVKVFYTDNGSDPVVTTVGGVAQPGSADTKELEGTSYYSGWGAGRPAAEWKIVDAVCGETYKVIVTSLSGANRSGIASHIHRPERPKTNDTSGAWKSGYLTHLVFDYEQGSTIYYTMGLAPVEEDGTVSADSIANIPNPTTDSSIYNPETGILLMEGRSETQAVVVKAIAAVEGYTTDVSSYYYYEKDDITMLTEAKGKSEEEQLEVIEKVMDSMTLTELCQMTGGATSQDLTPLNSGAEGRTWGISRLGIPQNMLSDGPAGLRQKKSSTALMSWAGLASTWDVDAYEAAGELVGTEAKYYGIDIVLAPGMNIQRNPLGGRNFEYMSEDPVVTGEAAAGYIRGIQSQGVGVAAKHFVANEQETNRNGGNSIVSERALREIYMAPFERIVEEDPWTIMTSYNKLNGTQTAANSWLLEEVARDEWGFEGYFMTDWGATPTGSALIEAGNDMQQSGNSYAALVNWISEEGIGETEQKRRLERTRDAVRNILKGVLKSPSFNGEYDDLTPSIVNSRSYDFYTNPDSPYEESKEKNFEIATGGIVLMKNDHDTLPRTDETKFALISSSVARTYANRGATWGDPGTSAVEDLIIMGGGSGHVYFSNTGTLKEALEETPGYSVPYAAVDEDIAANALEEARKAVAATDAGIMVFSRTATEGSDNAVSTYALSEAEKAVLEAFGAAYKAAGKPFICLINSGSAMSVVEMEENADAILDVWMPGTEGPEAIAAILSGEVNPSGKLAQSFPVTYEDSPSIIMGSEDRDPVNSWGTNPVFYDEGVFVGYRYFDTFGSDGVAYSFGHGLSYTTFEFSDLKLSSNRFKSTDETITATVTVTNTGDVAGREVAQLYIGADTYQEEGRPVKELKAYVKTELLQPGESQEITFTIDKRDLQYYDDGEDPMGLKLSGTTTESNVVYGKGEGWTVEEGTVFTVTVGNTSESEKLAKDGVCETFTYGEGEEIKDDTEMARSGLDRIIAMIEGLNASKYTQESWEKVEDALSAAKEVRANGSATQAQLVAAMNELLEAFGNLEYGVQKLHLEIVLEAAGEILTSAGDYEGAQNLAAAVEAGQKVLADGNATQEEIDKAAYAILDELVKLPADMGTDPLRSLADAARKLLDGNYTQGSLAKLEAAIERAEAVLADQNHSDEEVSAAYTQLIDAIVNLQMIGNKAALKAMIQRADEIVASKGSYVASTIEGLEAVLANAKAVYDNDNANQSAVDEAIQTLTQKVVEARLLGDVDGNGAVTTSDSVSLLRYTAEISELDAVSEQSADVNKDGTVDTKDAALILQYTSEKISEF